MENLPSEVWQKDEEREALAEIIGSEAGTDCILGSSEEQEERPCVSAPRTVFQTCHPLSGFATVRKMSSTFCCKLKVSFPVTPFITNIFYLQRGIHFTGQ